MLFREIVDTSSAVAATRKRAEKTSLIAQCIGALGADAAPGACFLAGELRQGRIGLGHAALRSVHDVAPAATASLGIRDVDDAVEELASIHGAGSAAARKQALEDLFARATTMEQDFLRRLLLGELRQGALESLVIDALAKCTGIKVAGVRRARMLAGALPPVVVAALGDGEAALSRFALTLFTPVEPMLAGTAGNVEEALERFERGAFELKIDGARVQVHKADDEVRVYTRKLNEVTRAVPEVVEAVRALPVASCVLDGEVIALNADGDPLPFQVTMRRFGRQKNVDALRGEIPLSVFFFDVLAADGEMLIDEPQAARSARLASFVPEDLRAPRLETDDAQAAQVFFDQALERGHEGIMVKSLVAPYEAGRRGSGWLKLKQAHTLDLLVIAAEWGSGRREGWLSNLHLAARDPGGGEPVMLGKTFKGLSDALLDWQTRELLARETRREGHVVHVRPELVVEIAFNDLQQSPHYPAGLALRFARVKRYRDDKPSSEADTIETVRTLASDPP